MFKDITYLCSLSLQVKRSKVGSTRGTAKKLEVGFASGQLENSHHEKASLENLKNYEKILQKVTRGKRSFQCHTHGRIPFQISKVMSTRNMRAGELR